jgi:PAS domain S-box-containing protein
MTKILIKVLLIEDNPADAMLLKESLNADPLADFQLTVVEQLKQGLAKLKTDRFDVLLLDLGLPDSQGLQTFEKAHAEFPELPVVVLSGMTDELLALQAVQAGAQDYLVKGEAGWNVGPRAIRYAIERSQSQSAMRASEARFSTFFNSSPIPTAITRLSDNKIIEVNQAWTEITGYSLSEVVGRGLSEFNLWLDPEMREQIVGTVRREGVLHGFEFQMRRRSGEIATLLFSAELIEVAGEPCMLSMALDITERKQGEAKIHFQAALLDAVGQAVIATDLAGTVVYFNRAAEELYGWSVAEALGRNIMEINVPDISQAEAVEIMDHLNAGKTWSGEFMVKHRDGTIFPILVSDSPVADEAGKLIGIVGISADITDRRRAEESIRQSERQIKALLISLDDIVFEFDEDGTYINIWTADESLLVLPKDQLQGKRVSEIMGGEHGFLFANAIKRVSAGSAPESIEYPLDVLGGQRWFMAHISPILDVDGAHRTVSVLVRDITERRKIEDQVQVQLRRMRALNEIDRAISSSLNLRLSLDILLSEVLSQLEVNAASVLLLNPSNQMLEYETGKGFHSLAIRESQILLGEEFAGRVGIERKVLHIPDLAVSVSQFKRAEMLREENFVEYFGVPLVAKGMLKGVLEIFNRTHLFPDLEWLNYLETLGGQAAIAIDNAQLFEGMQHSNLELVMAYDATIAGWSRAMDLRDKETEGHSQRVTELTVRLAKKMGVNQQDIVQMRRGALLHDIGKLGVPDQILHKPDKLDRIEWAVMRQHPTYAFNMLMSIGYLRPALDIPYCHHEKWDGTGYPRGLKGDEIPLAARIFAIVDVWDALLSDRPYRAGWPVEQAHEYIIEESGKHFDPQVVEAFLILLDELSVQH